jgi:hypothetical protein
MKTKDIKKIEVINQKNSLIEDKLREFSEILEKSSETIDSKKLHLWKLIYDNALEDRNNAYHLYAQGLITLGSSAADHMSIGGILVKYLERMTKANDQLLELSKIVSEETKVKDEVVSEKDIFNQIEG